MTTSQRSVVLLSGGLDSTVALAEALTHGEVVLALTLDYGQRAREAEKIAARAIARHYDLRHDIVELPWYHALLPQALARRAYGEPVPTPVEAVDPAIPEGTRAVWVPNRNGVLLNIAAAYAEAMGADAVVFGANADEAQGFPDNTLAFRDALTASLAFSTLRHIRVLTPVGAWSKAQIITRGVALGVPLRAIWSCYGLGPLHCGLCASCQLLAQALEQAHAQTGQRIDIRFANAPATPSGGEASVSA